EAIEFLDRWSARAPGNLAPLITTARVYAEAKQIASAEQAYLRALDLDPGNQTIMVVLGRLLTGAALHDKAMEVWSRLAELAPESVERRLQIARIHYARLDPQAEDVFRSVLERDPRNQEALQRLAQLTGRKRGMLDAALALWEELAGIDETAVAPLTQRGRLL